VDKLRDVVGLYLNPPEKAVVFCVDEKGGGISSIGSHPAGVRNGPDWPLEQQRNQKQSQEDPDDCGEAHEWAVL
jgi:hypothetical protein